MHLIHELLISGLIVLGAIFALVGSYGMLKFPDLMTRLHAPTKATTLGVGGRWWLQWCISSPWKAMSLSMRY